MEETTFKEEELYTVNDFVYRVTPENLSALTSTFEAHLRCMMSLTKEQRRDANSGCVRWRETTATREPIDTSPDTIAELREKHADVVQLVWAKPCLLDLSRANRRGATLEENVLLAIENGGYVPEVLPADERV